MDHPALAMPWSGLLATGAICEVRVKFTQYGTEAQVGFHTGNTWDDGTPVIEYLGAQAARLKLKKEGILSDKGRIVEYDLAKGKKASGKTDNIVSPKKAEPKKGTTSAISTGGSSSKSPAENPKDNPMGDPKDPSAGDPNEGPRGQKAASKAEKGIPLKPKRHLCLLDFTDGTLQQR
jgi:hypothetical protein